MRRVRVIPVLQIENRKLVKTVQFHTPAYIGDPINALRIFNDKEVDEIVIVDIGASKNEKGPDIDLISQLTSECFMPLAYGGGITTLEQATALLTAGVEKVILGRSFFQTPELVSQITSKFGTQSVLVSMDVKSDWLGRNRVFVQSGTANTGFDPVAYAKKAEQAGAGELLFQRIEREGMEKGYDLESLKKIAEAVSIPVVILGGASSVNDFLPAIGAGASAVAAGSMFVYKGSQRGILINYPNQKVLVENLYSKIN
jgi:imidazole glycerol-phosphate synthase subunit HisF